MLGAKNLVNHAGLNLLMALDDSQNYSDASRSTNSNRSSTFGNVTHPQANKSGHCSSGNKTFPLATKRRAREERCGGFDPSEYKRDFEEADRSMSDPFGESHGTYSIEGRGTTGSFDDPWTPSRITFNITPAEVETVVNVGKELVYKSPSFAIPPTAHSTPKRGGRAPNLTYSLSTVEDSSNYRTANDNTNLTVPSYHTPPQDPSMIHAVGGPAGPLRNRTFYQTPPPFLPSPGDSSFLTATSSSLRSPPRPNRAADQTVSKPKRSLNLEKDSFLEEISNMLVTISAGELERLRNKIHEFQEERRHTFDR